MQWLYCLYNFVYSNVIGPRILSIYKNNIIFNKKICWILKKKIYFGMHKPCIKSKKHIVPLLCKIILGMEQDD